jgi:hypothetical protein
MMEEIIKGSKEKGKGERGEELGVRSEGKKLEAEGAKGGEEKEQIECR